MRRHILSVAGYVIATFVTQATSHFAIFAEHYAGLAYLKAEPVFALGLAAMIVQGAVLSFAFANSRLATSSLMDAVRFSWLFGAFLVSYVALGEAGKYEVPNIASWVAVELAAGFVQFTLAGLCLGLAHGAAERRHAPLDVR